MSEPARKLLDALQNASQQHCAWYKTHGLDNAATKEWAEHEQKARAAIEAYVATLERTNKWLPNIAAQEGLLRNNEELRSLLRRSLQLPRPWMDGGITWEKWNELFSDIEKAVQR